MRTVVSILAIAGAALACIGCDQPASAVQISVATAERPSSPRQDASGPPIVAATKVKSEKVSRVLRLPSELKAFRDVALHAKVAGFMEKIAVDRGSRVKAGDLLACLVAPELIARKQEAEAGLAAEEATYRRLKEASGTPGVVAGNDLEVAAQAVEGARARVRDLDQQMSYLQIRAPFDGIITERNVHEGSYVGPPSGAGAVPLLRLQETDKLRLAVAVPEPAAGDVPAGKVLSFTVAAFPGETFEGTIARHGGAVNPRTRTLPVELDVENPRGRLLPGMFADVRWSMERARPSLLVPATAVMTTTERTFVCRLKDGTCEWVDVRPGIALGDRLEVFCELSAGDVVAVRGTDELRAGMKVGVKLSE